MTNISQQIIAGLSEAGKLNPGTKVKVSAGSGVDSGKTGTVVGWNEVKTDGRGVPTNVPGEYRPLDAKRRKNEVPVRLDSGNLIIMFKNRLQEA